MASITFDLVGADRLDILRNIINYDKQCKQETLEETIKLVAQNTAPWPEAIINRICLMMDDHFEEVLTYHPGYKLYNAHESVRYFLKLFNLAHKHLETAIQHYHTSVKTPEFFSRRRKEEHDHVIFVLNQCIFNLASAADALRNFSMKQATHYSPADYEQRKNCCFTNNTIHQFIQKLRVSLHHENFTMASPSIVGVSNEAHETKLYLKTKRLLRLDTIQKKKEVREFVEKSGEKIDIQSVFQIYADTVNEFHEWLCKEMGNSIELSDYRKCLIERRKRGQQATFSIFLQQWIAKGLNPHDYLDKYLTDEQITAVKELPHNSKEQVDKIIEFGDTDSGCNDGIRKQIYKLFKVSA